jgi:hypothetical protein
MTTNEIAQKLTDEGFTNTNGETLTRKSIESKLKLKSNKGLKDIYDSSRKSGG